MPEDRAISVEARAHFLLHALHHLQELCGKENRRSGGPSRRGSPAPGAQRQGASEARPGLGPRGGGALAFSDKLHKTRGRSLPATAGTWSGYAQPRPQGYPVWVPAARVPRPRRSPRAPIAAPHSLASLTVEVNAAIVVLVPVFHQGFNLLVRHVLPRGPEDLSQLLCINVAICVPLGRRDREGLRDSRGSLSRPHSAPPPAPSP